MSKKCNYIDGLDVVKMGKGEGKRLIKEDSGFSGLDELIASIEETISREESEIYTEKTLEEAYNPPPQKTVVS